MQSDRQCSVIRGLLDTLPTFRCPLFQQIFNFLYWLYWWTLDVPSTRQTQFVYSWDFLLEKSCLFYLAEVSISATFLYLKTNRYLSLCWWLMLEFLKTYFQSLSEIHVISSICVLFSQALPDRINSFKSLDQTIQPAIHSCFQQACGVYRFRNLQLILGNKEQLSLYLVSVDWHVGVRNLLTNKTWNVADQRATD